MNDEIKEIQDYLWDRGISASETTIVAAAIRIATRWGGKGVFLVHFKNGGKKK